MDEQSIHLPKPSFWPLVLAASLTLIAIGVVAERYIIVIGIVVLLVAITGWVMENRNEKLGDHHE